MSLSRRFLIAFLGTSLLATAATPVRADASEDLTIIVPLGSGGALDKMARHMAQHLTRRGDFAVTVENRIIKGERDGYRDFLDRPADGSTVLAWFEPAAAKYEKQFSYDDLAILNVSEIEPPILAARRDLGWASMEDFVAEARRYPGKFRIGAGRAGGNLLLMARQFEALGIDISEVDYASGGKARKGLLNHEVDITVGSLKAIKKLGDSVIPLAVMSPRRLRLWPEVPSISEAARSMNATPIYGASYRFFAVRKQVAEERPAEFERLMNDMRALTLDDKAYKKRYGGATRWFGSEDSLSLLSRAHAHFLDLKSPEVSLATQPKK